MGKHFNTFVIEYADQKAARQGVVEMFKAFPFMPDDKTGPHTVAASTGDRVQVADDLLDAGTALLEAAERHIFGDECMAEREAMRAAIAKASPQSSRHPADAQSLGDQ